MESLFLLYDTFTLPRTKNISLSANCFFPELRGQAQDLKLKNGSSTELFDCQTYLESRFWNFFTYKLNKTVAEGINRGIKGLK